MNNETKKDLFEAGTAALLAVAGGPIAVAASVAPTLISTAWMGQQKRRADKWWQCILRADAAGELQAKIQTGLLNDSEHVIAGVVEGACAACAAVDLAAVPIIAELSRRFIAAEDIPRWFYRGSLDFLERLSALEIASMRLLLQETEATTDPLVTIVGDVGDEPWRFFSAADPGLPPHEPTPLTEIEDADRLFAIMKRSDLGFECDGWGYAGSSDVIVVKREVLCWLRAAFVG